MREKGKKSVPAPMAEHLLATEDIYRVVTLHALLNSGYLQESMAHNLDFHHVTELAKRIAADMVSDGKRSLQ